MPPLFSGVVFRRGKGWDERGLGRGWNHDPFLDTKVDQVRERDNWEGEPTENVEEPEQGGKELTLAEMARQQKLMMDMLAQLASIHLLNREK